MPKMSRMCKGGIARLKEIVTIALALCLCCAPLVTAAQDAACSLEVMLTDPTRNESVSGAEVVLYRIADFADDESVQARAFTARADYASLLSTLDLSTVEKGDTPENAAALVAWIDRRELRGDLTAYSDENGRVTFSDVARGIYLVRVATGTDISVKPFLMEVPLYENGSFRDRVIASPKVSWNITTGSDGGGSTQPGDSHIPQTGRARWPVPVLTMLGVTLVVGGYVDRCFRGKKHSEK